MSRRSEIVLRIPAAAKSIAAKRAIASRRTMTQGKGARISSSVVRGPYLPPEDWYEPGDGLNGDYYVIQQPAGEGFKHFVTEADVRARLAQLPEEMVQPLEVVQFSRMTQKKRRAPCYGMQWGTTIYLYPIEACMVERFSQPPKPQQQIEAQMFGATWEQVGKTDWNLVWTEQSIRDFYLNNVLVHELGHILDQRNTSHVDRERWAEWFALEYGYKPSRQQILAEKATEKYIRRRHHKKSLS